MTQELTTIDATPCSDHYDCRDCFEHLQACLEHCRQATLRICARALCGVCATGKSYHRAMNPIPARDASGEWRHEPAKGEKGGSVICDAEALFIKIEPNSWAGLPQTELEKQLDSFVQNMQWSAEATDYQKTLVLGNLRGFVSFVQRDSKE